jgi:hypothetical protein
MAVKRHRQAVHSIRLNKISVDVSILHVVIVWLRRENVDFG